MTLIIKVNKLNKNLKIYQVLENIPNNQSPYNDKYGLENKNLYFEEGSISMMKATKKKELRKSSQRKESW
jgi:hypothetical protein